MTNQRHAARAYQAVANIRNLRDQEADVFRRATGALRASRDGTASDRARAVADNRRLWSAVADAMRDPANALPRELRAGVVSVAHAVRREMQKDEPNIAFLIDINETMTDGLAGQHHTP